MTKIEALRADLELRERLKAEWATIRTADLRALVDCASLAAQAQDILYASWQGDLIGYEDDEVGIYERRVLRDLMVLLPTLGIAPAGGICTPDVPGEEEESP